MMFFHLSSGILFFFPSLMPKSQNVKKRAKIDSDMHLNDTLTFSAVFSKMAFGVQPLSNHTCTWGGFHEALRLIVS